MRVRSVAALAALFLLFAQAASARTLGSVQFLPCTLGGGSRPVVQNAQCADFSVAENPDRPQGRRIALKLALVPAHASKAALDPVVLIAGGPGQSALRSYPQLADALDPLRKKHDILLVDQRGTGGSAPLRCALPDWKKDQADNPLAFHAMAESCRKELEPKADLARYTTSDAVRDLEAVRQALGAPQLNLYGVSYGTRFALEYLRRHPESVRSVILDSVAPPELALGQDFGRNLDDALALIFAHCRADKACHDRFGDPADTLVNLRERLKREPMRANVADPVSGQWSEQTLRESALIAIVRMYAYAPEFVSLLPLLLDSAFNNQPQPLMAQGEMLFKEIEDDMMMGMQLSVICAEDALLMRPDPAAAKTLLGDALTRSMMSACEVWPHGTMPADFKQPVKSDKPVLLLSGEWDPVTPPRNAAQVAATLPNGRALVAKGQGHNVLPRGCMLKLAAKFVETLDARKLDVSCLDALAPTPPFLNFEGPAP